MELQLVVVGVLALGYAGYKLGGSSSFKFFSFHKKLPGRKPPSPDKIRFERVTLDITPANLLEFIRKTATLRGSGFRLVADFVIAAWPDTYLRAFVHEEKPLYALIVERIGQGVHIEFLSLGDDLSTLTTSGSEEQADPSRPAGLMLQLLPGFKTDELFMQHLSMLDDHSRQGKSLRLLSRETFFEDYRASLVIAHELRRAKHVIRKESMQAILSALPALPIDDLIKRYDSLEHVPIIPVPAATPSNPSHFEGAIELRVQANQDVVAEKPRRESLLEQRKQALKQDDVIVLEMPEPIPMMEETPSSAYEPPDCPFIVLDHPDPEATEEPIEAPSLETEAPAIVPASPSTPKAVESVSPTPLPFQTVVEPPETKLEATPSGKPTCPHCGATLFSTLSSRCSKCKQSVR